MKVHRNLPADAGDMKAMLPAFRVLKRELLFTAAESIYRNVEEEEEDEEDELELENELLYGVSVNQGVLRTPLGSWPISKISGVRRHTRPVWLTMVFAFGAGFVVTQLWVLA